MSPRVTIGMPLYRNADTLSTAIASLQAQSFADFEVIISDDNSPDGSADLCAALIEGDRRFRLVRQATNLRYGNFGFLLRSASGEFFAWLAGDDHWAADMLSVCVEHLDREPACVLVIPEVEFVDAASGRRWKAPGTFPLHGTACQRVVRFLTGPPLDNSRMYGLMRTEPAKRCFPADGFHAYDWGFSAALALEGEHDELPGVRLWRDKTPSHRYIALAREDARHTLDWLFPIWRMTVWLLRRPGQAYCLSAWGALFALNAAKHREMIDDRWPYAYHPFRFAAALRRRLVRAVEHSRIRK